LVRHPFIKPKIWARWRAGLPWMARAVALALGLCFQAVRSAGPGADVASLIQAQVSINSVHSEQLEQTPAVDTVFSHNYCSEDDKLPMLRAIADPFECISKPEILIVKLDTPDGSLYMDREKFVECEAERAMTMDGIRRIEGACAQCLAWYLNKLLLYCVHEAMKKDWLDVTVGICMENFTESWETCSGLQPMWSWHMEQTYKDIKNRLIDGQFHGEQPEVVGRPHVNDHDEEHTNHDLEWTRDEYRWGNAEKEPDHNNVDSPVHWLDQPPVDGQHSRTFYPHDDEADPYNMDPYGPWKLPWDIDVDNLPPDIRIVPGAPVDERALAYTRTSTTSAPPAIEKRANESVAQVNESAAEADMQRRVGAISAFVGRDAAERWAQEAR